MTPTRDWDAASYRRTAAPVEAMGQKLLDRLELRGDETVLDAGCGTGGVTLALLERLPRGRVIAVDGSPSMVAAARARLDPARAEVRECDLLELELSEPVDAIFSSATFHWIGDHPRLFSRLHAALRPGGRLVAQCGGAGNVAEVLDALGVACAEPPWAEHLAGHVSPWCFATPQETVARLTRPGFTGAQAGLHTVPVTPEDPREYFATIMLGSHLERLPAGLREGFVTRVLDRLGPDPTVVYIRLTMTAGAGPAAA